MWRCPICHTPLTDKPNSTSKYRTLQCENNHAFDQAKQGYFNLLPVQHKRSKVPGDDKSMVLARHAFLSRGYYDHLIGKVYEYLSPYQTLISSIYDAGCGTGYYLNRLSTLLQGKVAAGHDISKEAIICASKAYKNIEFCVASTVNIPVNSDSVDLVIQVFSPSSLMEYQRIMKEEAFLVVVDPSKAHLKELKQLLYDNAEEHQQKHLELEGFEKLNTIHASETISFETSDCALNLLKMTPYYWRANETQKESVKTLLQKVTSDFSISIYQKRCVKQ